VYKEPLQKALLKITQHKEFIPERKTVNAEFYKGVMDRLLKRIQGVRTDKIYSVPKFENEIKRTPLSGYW